jgi:hypothetical protein
MVSQKVILGSSHVRTWVQGQVLGGFPRSSEDDISSLGPYLSYNLIRVISETYHS